MPHIERTLKSKVFETVAEKLALPVKLEIRSGASLQSASDMDSKKGNFKESANHYHTVYEQSSDLDEKFEALFGLSQQLINLGNLGQSRTVLETGVSNLADLDLDSREALYYAACINEKLGWINDLEGNYKAARASFKLCLQNIHEIKNGDEKFELTPGEEKVFSTAIHFLGRAHFGLGDYLDASLCFYHHLERPNLNKDEVAYDHAWIARCYIREGDFERADWEIALVKNFFEEYLVTNPERGTMAQYYMLSGERAIYQGDMGKARNDFETALGIYYEKERYPRGEARALYAIAGTCWAQKDYGGAIVYAVKGFLRYKPSLLKPQL